MVDYIKGMFLKLAPPFLLSAVKRLHYVNSLKTFDATQEPDLLISEVLISKGDSVVDIGANIGWYTKVFSRCVGESGCVYSIEPVPPTYDILVYCIEKLGLKNVYSFNVALSDRTGTSFMEIPKYEENLGNNYYMARLVKSSHGNPGLDGYEVKLSTLDELLGNACGVISFVKCDVEGHEWPVIKGAKHIIMESKAAWLIEISSDPVNNNSDANKIFSYFSDCGYKPYWYDQKLNKLNPYRSGDVSVNYFFLTDKHRDVLQDKGISLD